MSFVHAICTGIDCDSMILQHLHFHESVDSLFKSNLQRDAYCFFFSFQTLLFRMLNIHFKQTTNYAMKYATSLSNEHIDRLFENCFRFCFVFISIFFSVLFPRCVLLRDAQIQFDLIFFSCFI